MGTGDHYLSSDLYGLHNVVQNTMLSYPKALVIDVLRDIYRDDSWFHYVRDPWGFPLSQDQTDLPSDAGYSDDVNTRLYIGEKYKQRSNYFPCLLVSMAGTSSVPISMNRERNTVKYSATRVVDGYGNQRLYTLPTHFIFAGAWEGSLLIEVKTRGVAERDELAQFTSLCLTDICHERLYRAGLLIKRVQTGSPTESDDRNDKIYSIVITADIRSEWRREIPVGNIVDVINVCIDFGYISVNPPLLAPNMEINTTIDLIEQIQGL